MKSRQERQTIVGLDVIRFCAAAMVMCFHLGTQSWSDKNAITSQIIAGRAAFPELQAATWFDWIGVEIFFVISGFVIAYSGEGSTALGFLRSRILRLYPAVWICASITAMTWALIGFKTHRTILREWLNSITLDPFPSWSDPSYWTLGVEVSFYALVFFLLVLKRFHFLERMVLTLGCASSAYWILGTTLAPDFLQKHFWDRLIDLSLVSYGCFFAMGTMAYIITRDGLSLTRVAAMTVFVVAGLLELDDKTVFLDTAWGTNGSAIWPQLVFLAVFGCIIVSTLSKVSSSDPTARYVRMLGLATYPLYLIHQIVGTAIMAAVLAAGGSRYAALGSAILLCIMGSLLIANFIEPPLREMLRTFLLRVRTPTRWVERP